MAHSRDLFRALLPSIVQVRESDLDDDKLSEKIITSEILSSITGFVPRILPQFLISVACRLVK